MLAVDRLVAAQAAGRGEVRDPGGRGRRMGGDELGVRQAIPRRERRVEERADEAVPKQRPRLPFGIGHHETLLSGGTVPLQGRGRERSIRAADLPPPRRPAAPGGSGAGSPRAARPSGRSRPTPPSHGGPPGVGGRATPPPPTPPPARTNPPTGRGRAASTWATVSASPRPALVARSVGGARDHAASTAASADGPSGARRPPSPPRWPRTRPARRPAPRSPTHPAAIPHRGRSTAGTPFRRCGTGGTAAAATPSGRGGPGPTAPTGRGCLATPGDAHSRDTAARRRGSRHNTRCRRRQRPQSVLGWLRWGHRLTSVRTRGSRCLLLPSS